ncbi:acyltransferase family protein [Paraburkholderia phytofirmans]|nr:acyltransferase [Paraburkholderia phytofirmans]
MAWWVVFAHSSQLTGIERILPVRVTAFMDGGEPAVNVFIMLSGFVITHLCLSERASYAQYIRERAFRIYPVYLLCLALGIATLPALLSAHSTPWSIDPHMWQVRAASEREHFAAHFLLHVSLLHGLVPDSIFPYSARTLLGPAWSLSLEWQFYLIAPLIVALVSRSRVSLVITSVVLLAMSWISRHDLIWTWQYPSMVLIPMPLFLIGILTRVFWGELGRIPVGMVLLVGIVAGMFLGALKHEFWIWTIFVAAALQESRLTPVRGLAWLAANPFVVWLGKASYSTYLVHIPLLIVAVSLAIKIGGPHVQLMVRTAVLGVLILVIPISQLLYQHVEKRFMVIGRRKIRPSFDTPTAADPAQ